MLLLTKVSTCKPIPILLITRLRSQCSTRLFSFQIPATQALGFLDCQCLWPTRYKFRGFQYPLKVQWFSGMTQNLAKCYTMITVLHKGYKSGLTNEETHRVRSGGGWRVVPLGSSIDLRMHHPLGTLIYARKAHCGMYLNLSLSDIFLRIKLGLWRIPQR